ncbi:MAG: ABC transporter ATP-binding protein [Clostridiaceae bacterium]|nr:ABC transporter ATP-binding protein [Clostridiaceae bacterium]
MNPSISVNELTKIYSLYDSPVDRLKETLKLTSKKLHKDFFALDRVSFEVFPGETVGIIGKNGAGKSTLLKIITGVLTPTSGSIAINGKISALLELGAGFNPEYTGLQNVYLNGTIMGYSREEMDEKMERILEFADIGNFIHQPVKSYSSGMFMRLAFSVAINVEPEILIIDEALSVGDILFQSKCFKKFQELKDSGKTILFVTHSLSNVIQYCDRCIVMDRGAKIAEGDSVTMVDLFKKILVSPDDREVLVEELKSNQAVNLAQQEEGMLKDNLQLNATPIEYGNKEMEIIDFGILDHNGTVTNIVSADCSFKVVMRVRANVDKSDPIYAFSIKNMRGVEITGTNTMYNGVDTGKVKKGEVVEVTFTQQLPLPSDGYLLSLGCTTYTADDFVVYHRLYDVAPIQVISDKDSVGFFDPNSQITIKPKQ